MCLTAHFISLVDDDTQDVSDVTLLDAAPPRRLEQVKNGWREVLILNVLLQREQSDQQKRNEEKGNERIKSNKQQTNKKLNSCDLTQLWTTSLNCSSAILLHFCRV